MERNISRLACVLALSAVGFGAAAAETIGNLQDVPRVGAPGLFAMSCNRAGTGSLPESKGSAIR